ncbi:putative receptor protein kinase ZmPK1 [Cucurbita moschata]|uniref:Receptor-like serine/threonine-protein kinase n=1 Tax=Cucurbita moschata TaxID=3662 RepID=A0A6J1F922_CUCMO|nr:putative receptor protein kinase ZmPK1 [Cucurbita moschata]
MFVSALLFYLLLSPFSAPAEPTPPQLQRLTQGGSIAVEDQTQFLTSPDGTFSSGFYKVGNNSFCYSIWFAKSADKTVVWMANRDNPVNGHQSKLILKANGNLILTDADGSLTWSSNTITTEQVELRLLENGNLVLMNQNEGFIWQSFDSPTDTLLPQQQFLKNSTLVSMRNPGTYLSGFYFLKFNDDNVLNLIYNSPSLSSIYWPDPGRSVFENGRTRYNSSRVAILNDMGRFESTDNLNFNATDYGFGPKRRLTMDYDGVLRLYSLVESTGTWNISWLPMGQLDACLVHGLCGEFGICSYNPLPTCTCPPGFTRNDASDWSKGCKPSFNLSCDSQNLDFMHLPRTDYYGYDLVGYTRGVSVETCRNSCLKNCQCLGFGYSMEGFGQCFPKGALRNGNLKPDSIILMHIKIPKENRVAEMKGGDLKCSVSELVPTTQVYAENKAKFRYMGLMIGFVGVVGFIEFIFIGFGWWNVFQKRVNEELVNMGYIVLAVGFKRFTYAEMNRATRNFEQVIGKGGFGTVYKGELDDGRAVAVKRLEGVLQGEAEFWAEVSIIGKINHKNLVKLWGFCAEKHHKMLVYEFVKNGSLDKLLFSDSSETLGLEQRYDIAVGTAKGLSYLHEECLEWVLHCDVKPQNILLDEGLEARVADFGMSKLFGEIKESGFSRVRGTRGYLAPEWMMDQKIDAKADVYSFGIVLLELVSGKCASKFHLVRWMMESIEQGKIEDVIDPRLAERQDRLKIETLVRVGLLCVKEDRNLRPAMSKVVEHNFLALDCKISHWLEPCVTARTLAPCRPLLV